MNRVVPAVGVPPSTGCRVFPVVTLLCSSAAVSRRARNFLSVLFDLDDLPPAPAAAAVAAAPAAATKKRCHGTNDDDDDDNDDDDALDRLFSSRLPGLGKRWHSTASLDMTTGTLLHFLSVRTAAAAAGGGEEEEEEGGEETPRKSDSIALLSISTCNKKPMDGIQESRALLAKKLSLRPYGFCSTLALLHSAGRTMCTSDLLGSKLPLLDLPTTTTTNTMTNTTTTNTTTTTTRTTSVLGTNPARGGAINKIGGNNNNNNNNNNNVLKEVTIPHYDDATFDDGSSVWSCLSSSALTRPTLGVFQFEGGRGSSMLALRPLPSAREDRSLPPSSFVFHCDDLERMRDRASSWGARTAKIGYNGMARNGQIMVSHESLPGLDIRLSADAEYSSTFVEAQESLLAGSIHELQNVNVLSDGGEGGVPSSSSSSSSRNTTTEKKEEKKIGKHDGDCWIEFRATLKNPQGFINTRPRVLGRRIAKAPDIPFE